MSGFHTQDCQEATELNRSILAFSKRQGLQSGTLHYGTKPGHFETSKIHFPTSERGERMSERTSLFLFVPDHSALSIRCILRKRS